MAREYDDEALWDILDAMEAGGERITVNTFVAAVGGGCRSRLARVLKAWRDREREVSPPPDPDAPPPWLTEAVTGLGRMLAKGYEADRREQAERAQLIDAAVRSHADRVVREATERADALAADLLASQELLATAESMFAAERESSDQLRDQLRSAESERCTLTAALRYMNLEVASLRQEIADGETLRRELSARLEAMRNGGPR